MVIRSGAITKIPGIKPAATIEDIDDSTVDGTYGADEQAVIEDLRTKMNTLLAALEAKGILASS